MTSTGVRVTGGRLCGRRLRAPAFTERGLYGVVRHPLMMGFLIAIWTVPNMTQGNLLFAATLTAFILIALQVEERDLLSTHGRDYAEYQARVPMLIPIQARRRR